MAGAALGGVSGCTPAGDTAEAAAGASDPLERSCTCGTRLLLAGGGPGWAQAAVTAFYFVLHVKLILSHAACYNLGKSWLISFSQNISFL